MISPFPDRLRLAHERADLSQIALGVAIGLDETVASARISRYESGVMEPPFATIARLAWALHVPQATPFVKPKRRPRR